MIPNKLITYLAAAVVILGLAGVYGLNNFLEDARPRVAAEQLDEDLTLQGEKLKGWVLGFEGLLADWYWMRSLQYMGDKLANSKETVINLEDLRSLDPRLLYPLLDNATTLDPQFMAAYSYGAVVLPAIDPEQAIRIARKGIENNPGEWRLHQHLGYIYWRLKEYEKAAEVYEEGSRVEGAPPFFRSMTALMRTEAGSRETARKIYRQMLAEAREENVRKNAEVRLMQLDSLDERDAIRRALADFEKKNGRCASSWAELIPLLARTELPGGRDFRVDRAGNPVDPSNAPYRLDTRECEVRLDPQTSQIPEN